MVLRPDGTVFATGANRCAAGHTAIYNVSAGTWTAGPDFSQQSRHRRWSRGLAAQRQRADDDQPRYLRRRRRLLRVGWNQTESRSRAYLTAPVTPPTWDTCWCFRPARSCSPISATTLRSTPPPEALTPVCTDGTADQRGSGPRKLVRPVRQQVQRRLASWRLRR